MSTPNVERIAEAQERLALCREQIEASPYSHTIAAKWYAEDVPALIHSIEVLMADRSRLVGLLEDSNA